MHAGPSIGLLSVKIEIGCSALLWPTRDGAAWGGRGLRKPGAESMAECVTIGCDWISLRRHMGSVNAAATTVKSRSTSVDCCQPNTYILNMPRNHVAVAQCDEVVQLICGYDNVDFVADSGVAVDVG